MRRALMTALVLAVLPGPAPAQGPGTSPAVTPPEVLVALRETDERRRAYDPQGAWLGATRLDLTAEASLSHDDNVYAEPSGGRAALVGEAGVEAALRAGNEAYRLIGTARAATLHHAGEAALDHQVGAVEVAFAMDGWNRSRLRLETGLARRHERPGDPDLPGAAAATVPLDLWRAEGDLLVRRGLWLAGAEGALRRLNYYDTARRGGGTLDQDDRDRWESDLALRAGLAPTPMLDLYAAVEESYRLYDRPSSVLQLQKDSHAQTLWLGGRLERSERLALEAAVGRTRRDHASPWFDPVSRPVWRLAATFAPTPLTTLSGGAWRRLEETAATAYAAVVATGWQVEARHELLRNVHLRALWSQERRDHLGPAPDRLDRRTRWALGADWRLDHHWGLGLEAGQERRDSTADVFDMRRRRLTLRLAAHL